MELSFIAWMRQRLRGLPQVSVGIGDDTAVLAPSAHPQLATADALCDGTHFELSECGPRAVGRKLLGVNLSDIAAMGGRPTAAISCLCLPRAGVCLSDGRQLSPYQIAAELTEGLMESALLHNVAIDGGDTNVWDGPLSVSLTLLGEVPDGEPWLRSGGQVGDRLVVTGRLGGSILHKHLNIEPRLELARHLRRIVPVRAATDISDGLSIDTMQLAVASGCGALLDLERVPISRDAERASASSGRSALEHALEDGEDFELLLAIPSESAAQLPDEISGVPLTVVGELISRTGLWIKRNNRWHQLPPKGYAHQ
jgi:thiamine-monophosphate kinase